MRTTFTRRTLQLVLTTTAILIASGPLAAQQLKSPLRQLPADVVQPPATQQSATPPQATPPAVTPPPGASQQPAANGPVLQLSIDQAVDMGLETSLGLKAERLNVDITAQGIAGAQSAFIPTLTVGFTGNTAQRQSTDFTQGNSDISTHNSGGQGALDQALPWNGTKYHIGWNASRVTTLGGINTFNPQLGSALTFNVTQPLWRNFRIDSSRGSVLSSEISHKMADLNLQQRVVSTQANVQRAYLNLVGAIKGQEVAQQNMDIAQDSLRAARARVAVGVSPNTDVIQAQAQAASFGEQLIVANSAISTAEDQLRELILDPSRPDYWSVKLEPTSTILLTEQNIDADAVIKNALTNRLDAEAQRQQIEVTNLNLRVNQNLAHPSLDLQVSYTATGTAGTQFTYGSGFPPPVLGETDRSFSTALGDAFLGAYPSWTVGVLFGYPIGRSGAEAATAQNALTKRQQEINLQSLQIEIVREVREAVREVTTSYQRVQATQAALNATQAQLDAQQRRFEVGLIGSFELQQNQRDLATARQNDLQAKISYNLALITLNAVQKIAQ
jgi:outer membrane protein TolC